MSGTVKSVLSRLKGGGPAGKLPSACHEEHNTANERQGARDGRQRNVVCLFAGSVNRADVNQLFPGRVSKASPRKTAQTERNQDHSERFVHGNLLRRRYLAVTEQTNQCP
jgi:hypothetical protein